MQIIEIISIFSNYRFAKMESFKRLKMFPDKWYKKMTRKELKNSRDQLRSYALSKELEMGINEVSSFLLSKSTCFGSGKPATTSDEARGPGLITRAERYRVARGTGSLDLVVN